MPLTIFGMVSSGDPPVVSILKFVRNFLFVGENYYSWTLWYLNGLVFALGFIYILSRRVSVRAIFILSVAFYLAGVGLNWLGAISDELPVFISMPVKLYFKLFCSTRNGLFQSFAFLMIGVGCGRMAEKRDCPITGRHYASMAMLVFVKLICSLKETWGYCSEILTLPIFWLMFRLISDHCVVGDDADNSVSVKTDSTVSTNSNHRVAFFCRKLSSNIYFTHTFFVAICALVLFGGGYHNFYSFGIVSICAVAVGWIMIKAEEWMRKKEKA